MAARSRSPTAAATATATIAAALAAGDAATPTTCVSPETEIHVKDDDDDNDEHNEHDDSVADEPLAISSTPIEFSSRDERHLSSSVVSLLVQDDQWLFPAPVSPRTGTSRIQRGEYRYLRGADLEDAAYDFAIVTHRKRVDATPTNVVTGSSPDKQDGAETLIVDKLVASGLDVDIIEGDFSRLVASKGDSSGLQRSKYFVLLLRASDDVLTAYGRRLKFQSWLRSGNSREVHSLVTQTPIQTSADRIQVIDHIIRESARISAETNPAIHSVFPVHDPATNEWILNTFVRTQQLEILSAAFLTNMRAHFGEKVAYYFAFMDCYNKALVPLAVLGVVLTALRRVLGTVVYMQVLVAWAMLVSVGWSYWVLKRWSRRNSELNVAWENNLEKTQGTSGAMMIVYRNPNFRGEPFVNPVTGLPDQSYPSWKRYPKYVAVAVFMVLQIAIMMGVIACWITVFEVLQVRYPDKSAFSAQWFYILGGGVCYGLFVDVFQWNVIVTRAAKLFTEWENWKTIEQFDKSLIRKLFIIDFLNYYTWFFLLAFVYVIPGAGDRITGLLNTLLWHDPANCCFGPYLDRSGTSCSMCPPAWHAVAEFESRCVPCKGYVTFDITHLDLETLFVTPIIITQCLNLLLAVLLPYIHRRHHEQKLRATDKRAMALVKQQGERQILADMAYRDEHAQLTNLSKARFFTNDDADLEELNAKARAILFEAEQRDYDPYNDYHDATVQFGFVVMFSMLWPLMPAACLLINALKVRGDAFRLCRTTKRPFPRKASGIGEWKSVLHVLAVIGVIVNIGLVFVSTGAIEFVDAKCAKRITNAIGNDWKAFRFGPDLACFSMTTRVVMVLVCEHVVLAGIWIFWRLVPSIPPKVELERIQQEFAFKCKLYKQTARAADKANDKANAKMDAKTPQRPATGNATQQQRPPRATPHRSPIANKYAATTALNGVSSAIASPAGVRTAAIAASARAAAAAALALQKKKKKIRENTNGHATHAELAPLLSSRSLANKWDAAKSNPSIVNGNE